MEDIANWQKWHHLHHCSIKKNKTVNELYGNTVAKNVFLLFQQQMPIHLLLKLMKQKQHHFLDEVAAFFN